MTITHAKRLLPPFARGLGQNAVTVIALRDAVFGELYRYYDGKNPLEAKQVSALRKFLERTA